MVMHIHELKPAKGTRRRKRLLGRGRGSGHGKTSGKGHKGQKARSGRGILRTLGSGQVPLIRRIPKVGFRSRRPILYQIVNLEQLSEFSAGIVDPQTLKKRGFIHNIYKPYKILSDGELKKPLTVQAYAFSAGAKEKIEKAGGQAEIINADQVKKSVSETLNKSQEKSKS